MAGRDEVVITVHGVESLGQWQSEIHPLLTGLQDFFHYPHNYSRFRWWKAAIAAAANREIKRFRRHYSFVRDKHPGVVPSIVAHSFGTYIVSRALVQYGLAVDRLILCGSIIVREYDWRKLVRSGRIRGIRNEISRDDPIVRMFRYRAVRSVIRHSGPSGIDGFRWSLPQLQQPLFEFGHSGHFVARDHCLTHWLPYIRGTEKFMDLCGRCQRGPYMEEAERAFDVSYLPLIEEFTRTLSRDRGPAEQQIREYALLVREHVIREGAVGLLPAEQLIEKHALALERLLRRPRP